MKIFTMLFLSAMLMAGFTGWAFAEEKPDNSRSISGEDFQIINLDPNPEPVIVRDGEDSMNHGTLDDTPTYCGTPTETEANNTCAARDAYVLHCSDLLYAFRNTTGTDVDFFGFVVPSLTAMTIWAEDGSSCSTYPTANIQFDLFNAACQDISENSRYGFTVRNLSATDSLVLHLRVQRRYTSSPSTRYKVVTTCCPIRDCQNPIIVPAGTFANNWYSYEQTVNTCCGADVVDTMYVETCGQSRYRSGPDVIFKFVLATDGWLDSCSASGSGDNQVMIFTDCTSPKTSCVASSDKAHPYTGGTEVISDLSLTAGVYYVAVSIYESACGEMTLRLVCDVPLAVELLSFSATAGDGEVKLQWQTASESNNDHFEISRNGLLLNQIPATNHSTGDRYAWVDRNVENGVTYTYTLSAVDVNGTVQVLGTTDAKPTAADKSVAEYALHQNYPNPFNPTTRIEFDLAERELITLKVFNVAGQEVATLVSGTRDAGRYAVNFDASGLPSGVYWYRLEAGTFTAVKKMLLMK